jgi:hypothetical protein
MNLINILEENVGKTNAVEVKPTVNVLIGKAWVKENKSFSMAPLTEPVAGKQGEYQLSGVYPFIMNEYTTLSFGPNIKRDAAKNQNTHWVFLKIEKDRLEEYKAELEKIGQGFSESK